MNNNKKKKIINIGIACVVTLVMTIAVITVNKAANDTIESKPVTISGGIEFYGGHDLGNDVVYVNPTRAIPVANDHTGIETKSLNWWITESGEEKALYSSQNDDLESIFRLLRESGTSGAYMLQFQVEAQSGNVYRMGRNFFIAPDDNSTY